jgi:hypothetical protein
MQSSTCKIPQSGFGEYGGKISVMGSGGSNKVLGNFAPTPKCSKNDPFIVVGMGQNQLSWMNKKMDALATDNVVRAVFLNEFHYETKSKKSVDPQQLRFLGYYEFAESCYVSGNSLDEVNREFNSPSEAEWENLTF